MRKLLLLAALLGCLSAQAQQVLSGSDYIYKYQMSVGKTNATPVAPNLTNSSAWLEIGKDSTNKGVIIPRIIDTSVIASPVKGLLVYVIPESALYYRTPTKWERVSAGGSLDNYVKISDSTVYYYPLKSNPKGYITTESDPIALNKTVDIDQGPGIFVGGLLQTINNNPAFTISADNTNALWNANQLRGISINPATPAPGDVLVFNGLDYAPATIGSAGTVTSVGLSLPTDIYNITNSPVTVSGTLTGTFKNQAARSFWASPTAATGAPSFRTIVNNDFPASGVSAGTYGNDSVSAKITVDNKGILTTVVNSPIAFRWSNSGTNIYNNNAGNVGVGTAAPTSKFDVAGRITASNSDFRSTNSTIDMRMGANAFTSVTGGIGTFSNHHLVFATNNLERMRVENGGNVGVGLTTNISGKLSIGNDGNTELFFANDNPANILQGSTTSPLFINTAGGTLSLGTNNSGSQHLTILNGGNVGIGTATPGYKLEVNGTFRVGGNTTFAGNGTPAASKIPIGTDASGNWTWGLPQSELVAILDNIDILTANTYTLIPAVPGKRIITTYGVYELRSSTGAGTQNFNLTIGTNSPNYNNVITDGGSATFNSASAIGSYTGLLAPQVTQSVDSNPVMLKITPGSPVLTAARIRVFVRYYLLDL